MKLFLTDCRHCNRIIRSDISYCHHCGRLVLSLPPPDGGLPSLLRRKKRLLTVAAVLAIVLGVVLLTQEPWYERIAHRPDEMIGPLWSFDAGVAYNRIERGQIQFFVVRLGDANTYDDVLELPFNDIAFLLVFDFPVRIGRYRDTGQPYGIFDGYVDEKWSRFWVSVYAEEGEFHEGMGSFRCPEGLDEYELAVEISVLDRHRMLVLPQGIPMEGHTALVLNSPPSYGYVYVDRTTGTAYYYSYVNRVFTGPGFAEPVSMAEFP